MPQPETGPGTLLLRAVWQMVIALGGAYGISLTLCFLLRWTVGESSLIVATLSNILHLMLLPSLVLLPFMLVVRRWFVVATLALPFSIAAADNAPLFISTTGAEDAPGQPVHILTYNILGRTNGPIEVIRQVDADVVLLQELGRQAAAAAEAELADLYPYMALHPQSQSVSGQGVLSRYPIREDAYIQSEARVRLGHQRVVLDINGTAAAVYNGHPVHPLMSQFDPTLRTEDVNLILAPAIEDSRTMPVIFAGDFNLTPKTADYARIREAFNDAHRAVGFGLGYTFPAGGIRRLPGLSLPLARLDYVFYDGDWQAVSAAVWPDAGGSDHYPFHAELVLTAGGN